jgi:glycine dehydrogenase subunit 2
MAVIFDKSISGRQGVRFPISDVPEPAPIDEAYRRDGDAPLCELTELDVMRHFIELSHKNFSIDSGFYPLGSCTMKYNPKLLETVANMPGFANLHPFLPQLRRGGMLTQGALHVLHELEHQLCAIAGMNAFTLQPLAGAHGELTGLMLIAAYHRSKGNDKKEVLIPDEAHGTNPSSAAIAGFTTRSIPTDPKTGMLDVDTLATMVNDQTAAIMLTNPNTLGIFNSDVDKVVEIAHRFDAQVYYDGANLNAILGKFRPGDAGIDVMHINLHKTFATPHGGGGPGAGPVGVQAHLVPFLPTSRIEKRDDSTYQLNYDYPDSIGYIAPFYGNFGVLLRAYAYIMSMGREGLIEASENAVLNANYLMNILKEKYDLPYDRTCMHEFVISAKNQVKHGVHAIDIAKALMDYGFHPPTVYFPLIVKEAMMVEPTETESKETLDAFADAMLAIADRAEQEPDTLRAAPSSTCVSRPDELKAAKDMDFAHLD